MRDRHNNYPGWDPEPDDITVGFRMLRWDDPLPPRAVPTVCIVFEEIDSRASKADVRRNQLTRDRMDRERLQRERAVRMALLDEDAEWRKREWIRKDYEKSIRYRIAQLQRIADYNRRWKEKEKSNLTTNDICG